MTATEISSETKKKQVNRVKHLWKKGESGNPGGRPVGARNLFNELYEELRNVEREKKETFAHLLCRLCWEDPKVAVAMSKKFWPDKTEEVGEKTPAVINVNRIYLGENVASRSDGGDGSVRSYRGETQPRASDAAKNS